MNVRLKVRWFVVVPFVLSACWLGSIVHESDQASVISGAWKLAHLEAPIVAPGFYEYGKYVASYWMLGGLFKVLPSVDPVLLANGASFLIFWIGLFILLFSAPQVSLFQGSASLVALCSPALLVHLPYFAPNFLSAGFLFAGVGLLNRSRRNFPYALAFWFLAFGCRQDALLLIPLLAWLCAREESFISLLRSKRSWCVVGAGLLILGVSRWIDPLNQGVGYQPFFNGKIYAAYLIFGLGGAFLLFLLFLGLFAQRGRRATGWDKKLFWWAGGVAMLPPFLFYSLFMYSTRHWVLLLSALLLITLSSRARDLFNDQSIIIKRGWVFLLLGVLIPLGVGLRLPSPTRPRLVMERPTLFPTADGRTPMGAVVPFMFSKERLDHNQQVFSAARSVRAWEETDGEVPLANSPLYSLLELAVLLNHQAPSVRIPLGKQNEYPFLFVPCRTLLKHGYFMDTGENVDFGEEIQNVFPEQIAGTFPLSILRLSYKQASASKDWAALKSRILFFRQIFSGNEMQWVGRLPAGSLELDQTLDGRKVVLFFNEPFEIKVEGALHRAERFEQSDLGLSIFYVALPKGRGAGGEIISSAAVNAVSTVYPLYMMKENL